MDHDVNITQVENVYYRQENRWHRNMSKTRYYDAIVFFTEGEIEYIFPHRTVVAKKGDLLLLPGNLPYSGRRHTEHCSYYVIDLLCADERQFERFGAPCSVAVSDHTKVLRRFERALRLWESASIGSVIGLKAQMYALLEERFSLGEEQERSMGNPFLQYIENHLCDPTLSVAKICKELYVSDSQLRRTVHQLTGTSPNGYITALRLNKAKLLLSASDKSIKDIAYACGFASPYYFSRVFSKATGMSPSAYRTHID